MSCRRSHERFLFEVPLEATVLVLSDIVVCPEGGTLQVITHAPGVEDDVLRLDVMGSSGDATHVMRVIESRPVIVRGELRHVVQLAQESRHAASAVRGPIRPVAP